VQHLSAKPATAGGRRLARGNAPMGQKPGSDGSLPQPWGTSSVSRPTCVSGEDLLCSCLAVRNHTLAF
jgi:hypothetical protein